MISYKGKSKIYSSLFKHGYSAFKLYILKNKIKKKNKKKKKIKKKNKKKNKKKIKKKNKKAYY